MTADLLRERLVAEVGLLGVALVAIVLLRGEHFAAIPVRPRTS